MGWGGDGLGGDWDFMCRHTTATGYKGMPLPLGKRLYLFCSFSGISVNLTLSLRTIIMAKLCLCTINFRVIFI